MPFFARLATSIVLGSWIVLALPPAGAEPLTTEAAVALALQNHPRIEAAESNVATAEAQRSLARSGHLPRLELSEDLARSTNPVFVFSSKLGQERFGPADFAIETLNEPDALSNATTAVTLRQSLWDAGRTRLGVRAAVAGLEAASRADARTRQEVAFGALRAFWDAVLAREMLRVAVRAETTASGHRDLALELVEAGMAVPSDRMAAEVRLAEVRTMRIRAEQETELARAGLRQALGLDEEPDFELIAPAVEPDENAGDLEHQISAALAARADLAALESEIRRAELGQRMARSNRLPTIGVGARYEANDDTPFGTAGTNWWTGLSVRWSLFDGRETRARAAAAGARLRSAGAARRALAEGVRLEVHAAWADQRAAAERLRVAVAARAHAEEALRIVRERYGEGLALMVELLGAEAAATDAEASHVLAMREMALARAALDLATGRPVTGGSVFAQGEEAGS